MDIKKRNEEMRKGMGIALLVIIFVFFVKAVADGEFSGDSDRGEVRINLEN